MPLSANYFIMYILDVYPVMARLVHVIEKLIEGNSPLPAMLKASRAVIEKRKKELENGSAKVCIRCEHILYVHLCMCVLTEHCVSVELGQ